MQTGHKSLGERLVEARAAAGYGQEEVAKKVKMSQQSYSDLETGKSKRTTKIGSLAYILGVDAFWLETGAGEMRPATGVAAWQLPRMRVNDGDPAWQRPQMTARPKDEIVLMRRYHALTDRKKKALLDLIGD